MALRVPVGVARPFRLRAEPARAFALLRDVPAWGRLFPHVESVAPLAPPAARPDGTADAFVWTMDPLGPPGAAVQTVYACRYRFDDAARAVAFEPADGPDGRPVGNARFSGAVALADRPGGGTDGRLRLDAVLSLPAPAFARAVVEPAVALAFRQMTATFLERLDAALGPDA